MPDPVVHFEFGTKMPDQLKSFYGELFDWSFQEYPEMHYTIATTTETGERAINGGLMTFGDLPSAYLSLYVQVDDIQASIAKVGELGGTMLHGPMDVPGVGQIGMFTDPEGHMIGLIQPPPENKV